MAWERYIFHREIFTNYPGGDDKKITKAEAALFAQNNIKIVSIFQEGSYNPATFNYAKGADDATRAIAAAKNLNQPSNTPIFFGVEINVSNDNSEEQIIQQSIENYLGGVSHTLNDLSINTRTYKLGIYGPKARCKKIIEELYPDAYSMYGKPYGYGNSYSGWTIKQDIEPDGYTGSLVGSVDFDITRTSSYGGWLYHAYPDNWTNYGNAEKHRKKCLYCNHYTYQYHVPDSMGMRCTVCGYVGPISVPANNIEEEDDE
ncbi:MAG: DUF1906 domain-containing protein [Clostridia bacterium]|nr:DUF1906 domain-containing protein [Clostridia bacterium]